MFMQLFYLKTFSINPQSTLVRVSKRVKMPERKKKKKKKRVQSSSACDRSWQFADVFTKTVHNQVPLLDRLAPFMDEIVFTKEGETKLLKGLSPSKALGPDELHP